MKQTVEEAASENILFNHRTVDRTLSGKDLAKFGETNFVQGAEWKSKQSLWISVKERLPEPNKEVLLYDKNSIRHYAIGRQPLFGHTTGRHGKTMWMCFMKLPIYE